MLVTYTNPAWTVTNKALGPYSIVLYSIPFLGQSKARLFAFVEMVGCEQVANNGYNKITKVQYRPDEIWRVS